MKRLLPILLAALLLSGCGSNQASVPTEPTEPEPTYLSIYEEGSAAEQLTGGSVRAYPLEKGPYWQLIQAMKDRLLVLNDQGQMYLLNGQTGDLLAEAELPLKQWEEKDIVAAEKSVMYFDRENRQIVILDDSLEQTQAVPLPQESQGDPVIQASGEVFYSTGNQIRALDLHTGVSRLVREHGYESQTLMGSYFQDRVISCRVVAEDETEQTLYLSAATGEELGRDTQGYSLQTWQDWYFATPAELTLLEDRSLGSDNQNCLFGNLDGTACYLLPREEFAAGVLPLGGAVGCSQTEEALHFSYYDLKTGKLTAEMTLKEEALPGLMLPKAVQTDEQFVWILIGNVLYRWDITATRIDRDEVYIQQQFSGENPDAEGLAACQSRAEELGEAYGLKLYLWQEAMEQAGDVAKTPEHRVEVLQEMLDTIEKLLKTLPEGFARTTGDLAFCLVGELENGRPYTQFWESAQCRVVLDSQQTERSFLLGLGAGVDTRVLGNSREFDTWEKLNPRRFQYTYDYRENSQREDAEDYLDYFIDQDAMSYPTEDRSRIFAYALLPEGEAYFQKKGLQKKLIRMCEAIREAYDLEEVPQILPWEQYLEEPIAPEA